MDNPKTIADAIAQGLKPGDKVTIPFEVTHIDTELKTIRLINENIGQVINAGPTVELAPPPPPIDLKTIVYFFEGRRYELNFKATEEK